MCFLRSQLEIGDTLFKTNSLAILLLVLHNSSYILQLESYMISLYAASRVVNAFERLYAILIVI